MTVRMTHSDLERQVETYRAKALREHDEMRRWQNRALAAERKLADLQQECTNPFIERTATP